MPARRAKNAAQPRAGPLSNPRAVAQALRRLLGQRV